MTIKHAVIGCALILGAGLTASAEGGAQSAMKLAGSIMAENEIAVDAPAAPNQVLGQPINYCPSCEPWPRYSKDYDEVHANNDGSTTIVNPIFASRSITEDSSFDHACRDFGLGAAQAFMPQYKRDVRAVKIDSENGRTSLPIGGYWIVRYLTCSPGPASPASTPGVEDRCERTFKNSDGSFTILNPFVKAEGNGRMAINWSSDGPGVCRYFGFSRYVTSRLADGIFNTRTAVIGSEGRINKIIGSGGNDLHTDNPRDHDNTGLEFIVCK